MKENEKTEFKKSASEIKEALKSIAAILNKHQKGILYFGIKPDGLPIKNDISERTLRRISQAITNKIEPHIYPVITTEKINSVEVIKVVFEGSQTPYSADGRYYIRVADEDRQMTQEHLKQFILKNQDLRWDSISNEKLSLKDIDVNKIKTFCKMADIRFTNTRNILENHNLINNDKILNSAIILFGKNPVKYFNNAKLMCSLFASTNSSTILDQKEYTGAIFFLIEQAEKYILQNIHIGMKIKDLYRKDIPEIDKEAIREAVINAFLHRDYFDPDFVSVNIFKDRIEIRNPGKLFGGITIKEILTKNISRRRNEIIADILSHAHYVERKGRGIALIKEKEPNTEFAQVGGLFITTLKRTGYRIPKELIEKLVEGLVENQQKIALFIWENPKISKRELSEKLDISTTAVDKNIEKLKKINILERIGPAKGGRWKINEEKFQ